MRTIAISVVLALVVAATAQADPIAGLPPGWSHAEVNVVIRHQPHTLDYDRGRVVSVTASSIVLREADAQLMTITVGPNTKITIKGRAASVTDIRPLELATTMSIDGGAASFVRVRIPPALAAAFARQAARAARQASRQGTGGG